MKKPLQIAHRGGAGLWPENTMAAFRHALRMGVDGIELDLHLTRDGTLVVHHDERLKPAATRGADGAWLTRPTPLIKDLTADELARYDVGRLRPETRAHAAHPDQTPVDGARVPHFADVCALVKEEARPGFRLYVELKTSLLDPDESADPIELADAAVGFVEAQGLADRVTFVSFDWRTLVRAKALAPDIPNAFITLPFYLLNPEDPSASKDVPGSVVEAYRRASASGASWMAGFDWRMEKGASFAERILRAIASGPADGWFTWPYDVVPDTMAITGRLGLTVLAGTVDDETEMRRLAELGVDVLFTDRPDRLAEAMK